MIIISLSLKGSLNKSYLEAILKKFPLTDEQVRILRICFKHRIDQMKRNKLTYEDYIETGMLFADLKDADIVNPDMRTEDVIDRIFKDELAIASLNPKLYDDLL